MKLLSTSAQIISLIACLLLAGAISQPAIAQTQAAIPGKAPGQLLISAKNVLARQQRGGSPTLVDVRSPDQFARVRIPGTINLPLFAIRTKPYLQGRSLVLVGEAYHHRELLSTSEKLANQGFKAKVLYGGLYGWREAGGELEGTLTAIDDIATIPPAVFDREQGALPWQVVTLSETDKGDGTIFANAVKISTSKMGKVDKADIRQLLAQQKGQPFLTLLVLNRTGQHYLRLQHELTEAGLRHLVFLQGGSLAQKKYAQGRVLAQKPREDRLKVVSPCPTCKDKSQEETP